MLPGEWILRYGGNGGYNFGNAKTLNLRIEYYSFYPLYEPLNITYTLYNNNADRELA